MRLRISPLLDPALRQSQLGQDGSEPQGASAQIWTACRWELPPPAMPRFPLVVPIELPTNRNRGPHCRALDLIDCLRATWLRWLVPKSWGFSLGTCFSSKCLTGDVPRERESGGNSKGSHLVPFTSWQPGWQQGARWGVRRGRGVRGKPQRRPGRPKPRKRQEARSGPRVKVCGPDGANAGGGAHCTGHRDWDGRAQTVRWELVIKHVWASRGQEARGVCPADKHSCKEQKSPLMLQASGSCKGLSFKAKPQNWTQLKSRIYFKRKSKHFVSYKAFIKVNWKLSVSSSEKFHRGIGPLPGNTWNLHRGHNGRQQRVPLE